MGRGSGTFERLLGNASTRQLAVSSLAHPPDAASIGLRGVGRSPYSAAGLPGARHIPGPRVWPPGLCTAARGSSEGCSLGVREDLAPSGPMGRNRLGQSPES